MVESPTGHLPHFQSCMRDLPSSDRPPTRDNFSIRVPSELRQQLREEFEREYKKDGKTNMGRFLNRWEPTTRTRPPSGQTVRNFLDLDRGESFEYWLVDGFCRLLLGYSFEQWSQGQNQAQDSSPQLPSPVEPEGASVLPGENTGSSLKLANAHRRQDWGEAPAVSLFYGRTGELAALKQWIVEDRCRLLTIYGMGGIGKTALAVTLAQQIQDQFEWVIWRSLRNAPPLSELLAKLLPFLACITAADLPQGTGERISLLIECLRAHRCLLILEDVQMVLNSGHLAGNYQEGFEEYGHLIARVGHSEHHSCLVLTGWEKPREVATSEGPTQPVRSFELKGLGAAAREILAEKGLSDESKWEELIAPYRGNPLALKIVAATIKDVFNGSVADFLSQSLFLGDFEFLLAEQWERLSALEKEIMCCLARYGSPASLSQLQQEMRLESSGKLIKAVESLLWRSLVEKNSPESQTLFTLQPAMMKYVTQNHARS